MTCTSSEEQEENIRYKLKNQIINIIWTLFETRKEKKAKKEAQ